MQRKFTILSQIMQMISRYDFEKAVFVGQRPAFYGVF